MGVGGSGMVCDGHGLRDEAGASRCLPMEGYGRKPEAVQVMVCVDPGDAGLAGELLESMARSKVTWRVLWPIGLNSLFSAVKPKPRGYRSVEYMTTMLYFVAGKLTLPCY